MNGKIKSCKKIAEDKIKGARYFDAQGKLIKEEEYDFYSDSLESVLIFKYENKSILKETFNADGILVGRNLKKLNKEEKIEEEYDGIGNYVSKCFYKYDQNQKLLSETALDSEDKIEHTILYILIGNDEYTKRYDSNGLLEYLQILKFSEKKELIRALYFRKPDVTNYDPDELQYFEEYFEMMKAFRVDISGNTIDIPLAMNFLDSETIYEYDEFGNKILQEEFEYDKESSSCTIALVSGDHYEYNDLKMVIKHMSFEIHTDWDDKRELDFAYSFDEKGNVIEKTMNNGFNKINEKFSFNDSGKLVYYIEDRNNTEETNEKFYDDNGNLILEARKCYYDNEYEEEIIKYEIEYY